MNWVLSSATEGKHIIKDPLRRLSYTFSNGLVCTLFGLEMHLDINDRYYIASPKTTIQRVLSYSGCGGTGILLMLKPMASTFISQPPTCVTSDQWFSVPQLSASDWQGWLNVQIGRVGLIVLLLLHTDGRRRGDSGISNLRQRWDARLAPNYSLFFRWQMYLQHSLLERLWWKETMIWKRICINLWWPF